MSHFLIHKNSLNYLLVHINKCSSNGISLKHEKQPPEVFYKKRCSYKFCKIHRKTPSPESFFYKAAGLRRATLLKRSSGTGVFL